MKPLAKPGKKRPADGPLAPASNRFVVDTSAPTCSPLPQDERGIDPMMKDALDRYWHARYNNVLGKDANVQMQQAVRDVLKARGPLPDDIRVHLAMAFEHLCDGSVIDLLKKAPRKGGAARVDQRLRTESAVRYILWCGQGRIHGDPKPRETVGRAFCADRRTVAGWMLAWGDKAAPPLAVDWADQAEALMRIDGLAYQRLKVATKDRKK